MFDIKSDCLIIEAKQKNERHIEKRNNKLSLVVRINENNPTSRYTKAVD